MEKSTVYPPSAPVYQFAGNSNLGHTSNTVYPQPVQMNAPQSYFERNRKNKPQGNSAAAACLVFISGGMNIAWAIGYSSYAFFTITIHMRICWFIAAIIGAIVGATLCNKLQKKPFHIFSCLLVIASGIILSSMPYNSAAITAALYMNGFANGVIFAPTLIMAGEEAVKANRGGVASSIEIFAFTAGIYIQIMYDGIFGETYANFNIYRVQGFLFIIYGSLGLLFAFFLVIESPVYHMLRGQELEAIDVLRRLQRPFVITNETYAIFEEHKRYIAMNKEMSLRQSFTYGLPALFKLCLYRGLVALTFSSVTADAIALSSEVALETVIYWPSIVCGVVRFLSGLITVITMPSMGQKKSMLFGAFLCGGLAIAIGVIFDSKFNLIRLEPTTAAMVLLIVLQLFAGIFVTSSSAYLCEAFPLAVKPYFIVIPFITEMLVQIIIISCNKTLFSIASYFIISGCMMILYFVFAIRYFPETKGTTLGEAQQKFQQFSAS